MSTIIQFSDNSDETYVDQTQKVLAHTAVEERFRIVKETLLEQITNTFISRIRYMTIKTKGVGIDVYSSITLDCQTKTKHLFCEDCFARKTCKLAR